MSPERITRREFLKLFGLTVAGGVVGGCIPESKGEVVQSGTTEPTLEPTAEPTQGLKFEPTLEPTKTIIPEEKIEPAETPVSYQDPEIIRGKDEREGISLDIIGTNFRVNDEFSPEFIGKAEEEGWKLGSLKAEVSTWGKQICERNENLCEVWESRPVQYIRIQTNESQEDGKVKNKLFEAVYMENIISNAKALDGSEVPVGVMIFWDPDKNEALRMMIASDYGDTDGEMYWVLKPVNYGDSNNEVKTMDGELLKLYINSDEYQILASPLKKVIDTQAQKIKLEVAGKEERIDLRFRPEDSKEDLDFQTYLASVGGQIGDRLFGSIIPRAVLAQEGTHISSVEELSAEAPKVPGLVAGSEGDRVVYRAEAGNPYGMKEGDYAGYLFEFEAANADRVVPRKGIALTTKIREKMVSDVNTTEAIARGEWKMTMPFNPLGERIVIYEGKNVANMGYLRLDNISKEIKFRNPLFEQTMGYIYTQQKEGYSLSILSIDIPPSLCSGDKNLTFLFLDADSNLNSIDRKIYPGEVLFSNINQEKLPSSKYAGIQQMRIMISDLSVGADCGLGRFLKTKDDQAYVFMLDE